MVEHVTITSANCHEPKHISSATTSDAGKVITPSSTTAGTSELRRLTAGEITGTGQTSWGGWGRWVDSTYTSGSPFSPAASRTQLTNDGADATTDTTYLPSGSSEFWDTTNNKFVADNEGDAYLYRITFKGETGTASSYFTVDIDVGGAVGIVLEETKMFLKGAGTQHNFTVEWPVSVGSVFALNGATPYITPSSADQTFWDFEIQVIKLYSGA